MIENRGEAAREAALEAAGQPPQRVSTVQGEKVITLAAAAQRADGIKTVALANARHQERLSAYGSVLDLRTLNDLANRRQAAKAQLEIAEAKLDASRTAFERARKLYNDHQNISAAQLETAEAAFHVDQAGAAAAQSQLRMLGLTARRDWGPVLGQAVIAGAPLLERLVTGQDVLLQVTLRPGETVALPPAGAFVRLDGGARRTLQFVSTAARTDPRFQGVSLLFTASSDNLLLPGMRVVAFLAAGPTVEGAVVPPSAIVWQDGRAWAYFRTGPGTFARRTVATDRPAPDGGYIVPGIPDHAEVVVAGAQMLLSEEFRAETSAGGLGDTD